MRRIILILIGIFFITIMTSSLFYKKNVMAIERNHEMEPACITIFEWSTNITKKCMNECIEQCHKENTHHSDYSCIDLEQKHMNDCVEKKDHTHCSLKYTYKNHH